ncbi:MAG: repeat, subgroup, partial [Chthonomonadales bacterium]|nr:repeat, subgroup [Chthonomonadales bacterium]
VAWSHTGYYDSAAGSEDLIGWHLNHGNAQAGDFYPASRFRSTFYRPDVVERVLSAGGEDEALKLADADRGRKTQVVNVDQTLPPIVAIKSPDNNTEVSEANLKLQIAVRTPGDAPVTALRALIDGRPTGNARRIQEVAGKESADTMQTLDVTLPARDCEISVIAENKNGISAPATIKMHWKGKAEDDLSKPKLYILSVGVSKYKNPAYTLDFAAKDATDFNEALKKQGGKLYRSVETRLLTDDQASKEGLLDGLEWIQKQTTSRDVAMIFLSGHGVRDASGDYYYVPYAFDNDRKRSTGVLFYEIEKTIKDIAGKVVFFVDTCHSGGAAGKTRGIDNDIVSLVNELSSAENGAIVFAASTGKESALEDPKWGHGAFTKALLEGLEGKADLRGNGRITITSLDFFLSERVKELTDGNQHPTTTKPPSVPDFPIAIVK